MRNWLVDLRKRKGLTQEDVAARSFINRAYYAQIEKGSRNPSMDVAKQIAQTLGFSATAFYMDDLREPFQLALQNSPIIIAHCDLELRYTWIFNPHADFQNQDVIGKRDDDLAMNQGILDLMSLKQKVKDTGQTVKGKIRFPLSDGVHTYYVFGEPLRNLEGELIGIMTASMDISDS
ncbi:helix-turn-helix domain-containing protein [Ammoniphilus sp. CFH 90114]|uniref:helix-turn-helix domain-containing protein n=1 Tax=Ammoniphilus sp. CFH 90114 TaxID=2493665 RepID=UPI00100FBEE9|nr:helix-turn-helix domain-containing protein [Ammoniphilus sp. CFH 90114]RXT07986.1 helix-turn-helix domain-containing protein [Ammoniphilus sp. CFH 90114]